MTRTVGAAEPCSQPNSLYASRMGSSSSRTACARARTASPRFAVIEAVRLKPPADGQAFQQQWIGILPITTSVRTAPCRSPDVCRTQRTGMHDPRIDEPRLLQTGNDLDGRPSAARARSRNHRLRLGAAQGIRRLANAVGVHHSQPAPKRSRHRNARRRRIVQTVGLAEPGSRGEPFHANRSRMTSGHAISRDDHMKAVRAQIDGRSSRHDTPAASSHGPH